MDRRTSEQTFGPGRATWPLSTAWLLLGALTACGGGAEPSLTEAPLGRDVTIQRSAALATESIAVPRTSTSIAPARPAARIGAVPPRGVLLAGVAGMSARAAVRTYAEKPPLPAEASFDTPAPRTYLSAVISSTATVGQVNAALTEVGARIVAMQDGSSTLTLELSTAVGAPSAPNVSTRLAASRAFEPYQPPAEPVDDHLQPPTVDSR